MRINERLATVSVSQVDELTLVCVTPAPERESSVIEFLPVVSSLNSSMHNLRASAEWLLDTVNLSSEQVNVTAAIMMRSYFMVSHTLNNISTLQQLADGSIPFSPEWLDLSVFIKDLLSSVQALVGGMGLNAIFRPTGKTVDACVDEKLIEQLILNLLSNSLLHMKKGDTVTVTLSVEDERVFISVDDDGSGIDGHVIGDLFRAPVRETSLENISSGTGMGLYIARGIVDRHGGTILVESRVGQGTSARVMIPKGTPPVPRFSSAAEKYRPRSMDSILRELSGVLSHNFYHHSYLD